MYNMKNKDQFLRTHSYATRNRDLLYPSFARLNVSQRSLKFSPINIWNELPDQVKNSRNLVAFKSGVKNFYISKYGI